MVTMMIKNWLHFGYSEPSDASINSALGRLFLAPAQLLPEMFVAAAAQGLPFSDRRIKPDSKAFHQGLQVPSVPPAVVSQSPKFLDGIILGNQSLHLFRGFSFCGQGLRVHKHTA